MKKSFFCRLLAAAVLLALLLPAGVAAAAGTLGSRTFYLASVAGQGGEYGAMGEYLVLNDDGTGMVVTQQVARSVSWSGGENGEITFRDSEGYDFDGHLDEDGALQGQYQGADCVYERGPDAPVISLSPDGWGQGLPFVTDQADILSDGEKEDLSARAQEISDQYDCNVYIVAVGDMNDYTLSGSVNTCGEEVRTGYRLGRGTDSDCVMLLLSMADRDYDLVAYGRVGLYAFNDSARGMVEDSFLNDFANDDWAGGFTDYLEACAYAMQSASEGEPVTEGSYPSAPPSVGLTVACSVGLGFIVSLIICLCLKAGMKSTAKQTTAVEYIPQGGVDITGRYDQYTHTTETRVYDPPKESSSSSSTTTSSSGHAHSSGKF